MIVAAERDVRRRSLAGDAVRNRADQIGKDQHRSTAANTSEDKGFSRVRESSTTQLPYVTVPWRREPSELAVTHDEPGRETLARVIPARATGTQAVEDAAVLATSLVRVLALNGRALVASLSRAQGPAFSFSTSRARESQSEAKATFAGPTASMLSTWATMAAASSHCPFSALARTSAAPLCPIR